MNMLAYPEKFGHFFSECFLVYTRFSSKTTPDTDCTVHHVAQQKDIY